MGVGSEQRYPPGARLVRTPSGRLVVISAVEAGFYAALCGAGMLPELRWQVADRRLDFAFPDLAVGVEADGADDVPESASYWMQAGWSVMQFKPSQLAADPLGCAESVRQALADVHAGRR